MRKYGLPIVWLSVVLLAIVLLSGPAVGRAQEGDSCAAGLAEAVAMAETTCAAFSTQAAGLDAALCAGNASVSVRAESGGEIAPAALLALDGVGEIAAASPAADGTAWGLGVLRVPGVGAGEHLSAVLFGGAMLTNVVGVPTAPVCSATSLGTVNVRAEPNTNATVLGQLALNEVAPVTGRLADGTWWRILWQGETAWVFAELVPADCDPATMLVVDPATGAVSGGLPAPDFQNVGLESDFSVPLCGDAPSGGMLVQAGGEGATWRVNGVLLRLTGTALLQASGNDVLAVQVLVGQAVLEAEGVTRVGAAGQLLRVPMQAGALASLPGPALDVVLPDAARVPVALLPDSVTPPVPTPAQPDRASGPLTCGVLPQQVIAAPDDLLAIMQVDAAAEQTLRISAATAGGVQRLSWQLPDGAVEMLAEADGSGAPLVVDVVAPQPGVYVVVAEGAVEPVQFGLTCDLPRPTLPPPVQACADVLLAWDAVSGTSVRFTAPLGAQVSITAAHDLPSQGAARTLQLMTEIGESIGEAAFLPVAGQQAAGPLQALIPQDGTYLILWDGDPFNVMQVEALCQLPAPEAAGQ